MAKSANVIRVAWCAALLLLATAIAPSLALAGTLDPPAGAQTMPSLTDIYDRLCGHEVGTSSQPSAAAGPQATGYTLQDILDRINAIPGGGPTAQPFPPQLALVQQMPYPNGTMSPGVPQPSPRFSQTDWSGNSTPGQLRDHLTGLVWLQDPGCLGSLNYAGAQQAIIDLNNGLKDAACFPSGGNPGGWRMPTMLELLSLLDFRYVVPVLSNNLGTAKGSYSEPFANLNNDSFWTGTTMAGSTVDRFVISLATGTISRETMSAATMNNLVPVRSGNLAAPVAVISVANPVVAGAAVPLSCASSYLPNNANGATAACKWQLVQTPAGSTATLSDPYATTPSFTADLSGTYDIHLVVNFGTWDSPPVTASIQANVPPTAADTTIGTDEDIAITNGDLTPLASNPDNYPGSALVYSLVADGTLGTAVVNTDGSFTYTPNANANGTDSFTYRVYDGLHYSNTGTVTVNINPVSDAPVNTVLPAVTGTATVGTGLTADSGTWTNPSNPAGTISYAYQWYQDADGVAGGEVAITGATTSSYTVAAGDAGMYLMVRVTATVNGESASADSAFTVQVP